MTKCKIKDLKNGMDKVDIVVEIDFMGDSGQYEKGYGQENFTPAFVTDETGEIKMTFWGMDAKKAKEGMKIRVKKGYITEYQGQLQLNYTKENPIEFLKK